MSDNVSTTQLSLTLRTATLGLFISQEGFEWDYRIVLDSYLLFSLLGKHPTQIYGRISEWQRTICRAVLELGVENFGENVKKL